MIRERFHASVRPWQKIARLVRPASGVLHHPYAVFAAAPPEHKASTQSTGKVRRNAGDERTAKVEANIICMAKAKAQCLLTYNCRVLVPCFGFRRSGVAECSPYLGSREGIIVAISLVSIALQRLPPATEDTSQSKHSLSTLLKQMARTNVWTHQLSPRLTTTSRSLGRTYIY